MKERNIRDTLVEFITMNHPRPIASLRNIKQSFLSSCHEQVQFNLDRRINISFENTILISQNFHSEGNCNFSKQSLNLILLSFIESQLFLISFFKICTKLQPEMDRMGPARWRIETSFAFSHHDFSQKSLRIILTSFL